MVRPLFEPNPRFCSAERASGAQVRYRDRMPDHEPESQRLDALEERLREARRRGEVQKPKTPPSMLGIAFRLTTEFVSGVVVGGVIGWLLDRVFGTGPFLLIIFFLFGAAAGIFNAVRASRELNSDIEDRRQ